MTMTIRVAACAALLACSASASAGSADLVSNAAGETSGAAAVTAAVLVLPANTELTLTPNSDLSSKSVREGDTFPVSTVYDVMQDGYIVIPRGTRGQGKVAWRTGKGAFGKSAKMDLAFEWIEVGGRRVVIEGKHRQEGSGNTAATVGTALAAGVFSAFVTGKSATVPHGMQLKAFTAEPISFQLARLPRQAPNAQILPGQSGPAQGTTPFVTSMNATDHNQ
ncbi:MAG TPA: hypothetical protein VFF84_07750 [Sphingobium sp.]|nr:hypothetical protein [Sphingobium sp.]